MLGVELSQLAAQAFFEEQNATPQQIPTERGVLYYTDGLGILVHDWFELDEAALNVCATALGINSWDVVYDRAALVALPPAMRLPYIAQLARFVGEMPWLLVTVEYDQSLRGGPPFSIQSPDVEQLHRGRAIRRLGEIDSPLKEIIVQEAVYLSTPTPT